MFRFENPSAFFFLWLIPIVLGAGIYLARIHRKKIQGIFGEKVFPFLTSSVSETRRRWKWALEVLAILFAVIALARPQIGTDQQEVKSEGIELIIAFDVSSSMLAEDIKPSRIEFAKRELFRLIDELTGNKIGVVAFAGTAALVAPMTTDKSALKMFVDSLAPNSVSAQGTEFRKALVEAREAFRRGSDEDPEDETTTVTRAILVVSDGEDNEQGAIAAAEKLAEEGIHIFAMAVGTEKGAPVPVRDSNGSLVGYKRDKKGQTVLSQTKGTVLKKLASVGRGSFHHATFGASTVQQIAADVGELEQTEFDSQVVTNYAERYQIFLFLALVFAVIEILLGERFLGREIWRGRFEVPQR